MVPIRKNLCPKSNWGNKCPYSMPSPTCIVVHNTDNDASAANEIAYMIRNTNTVSFHYAVDDKEIVQGIDTNRNTYNAGDGSNVNTAKGNRHGISIEICYSSCGGERFTKAEQNAAELIAKLLKEHGWGIDRVIRHKDCNGKNCPSRTMKLGWTRFLNMVKAHLDSDKPVSPAKHLYRVRKSWADTKSQIGAYSVLANAKTACKAGYSVYDEDGKAVYSPAVSKPLVRMGSEGAAVKELQTLLNQKIKAKLDVDGICGSKTVAAIKSFQKAHKLDVDGICGKNTWTSLLTK